ncbi:MAG: ATP-binding protein [Deltaproteobacteria bacterium]
MSETDSRDLYEVCSLQLKRKESILDGISDALMLLDVGSYKILDVNQACLKTYKTTREQILGKTCHEVTHRLNRPCPQVFTGHTCPVEQSLITGGLCMIQHTRKDRKGNQLYFEITAYPLKNADGKVDRIVHLARDVTHRKRAEDALKEASEKIKLFAYSVAHDLKSPVIGLHGLTKRLHDKYKDALDEKGKDLCQRVLQASNQIAEFTEKINLFISSREVPLKLEWIDLKEILQTIHQEVVDQMQARRIMWFEPDSIPQIKADRLSIIRAVRNLVTNALKHGGGGLSRIEVKYEESDSHHVVCVADDGVGLNTPNSERVFNAFQRDDRSGQVEGSGLGLAIVKELAGRHKGKVWLEPGKDKGVSICVSIAKDLELSEKPN